MPQKNRSFRKVLVGTLLAFGLAMTSGVQGAIDEKAILQKTFPGAGKTPQCAVASRGPGVKLESVDQSLHQFVGSIYEKLQKGQKEDWKPLFHPKLRVKSDIGARIFTQLKNSYKQPWQFSVYRVFGLYAPKGDKLEIPCPDDQITITSRYGYPLQWGVWFQVMGQDELGRIFVAIAPRDGKWYIVGWHFQQWTQSGKDYEAWVKAGTDAFNAKDMIKAHISFDVAQKMLFGGEFVDYAVKPQIISARDQAMTKDAWLEEAKKLLMSKNEIYIGTVLAEDGVGILLRERLSAARPTSDLQRRCLSKGKQLIKKGWLPPKGGGLRCEFVLPNEDPDHEGSLGGIYLSREDISRKQL